MAWRSMGPRCLNSVLLYKTSSAKSANSQPCASVTVLLFQQVSATPESEVSEDVIAVCDQCFLPEKRDQVDIKQQSPGRALPALCTSNQNCLLLHFSHPAVLAIMVSLKPDKAFTHPVGLYISCFKLKTFTILLHALDYSQAG